MKKTLNLNKPGAVIPLIMLAVVLLSVVGMGLLSLGLNSQILSIRGASEIAARTAADAGLNKALYEMNEKLKETPWDNDTLPIALNASLPNCDATYSYTITGTRSTGFTIISSGKYSVTTKSVTCNFRLKGGPFEHALFAQENISLKNSALVDWYNYDDDDDALKVGTNSIITGAISLKNSATINGDVIVGLGGDPDEVIDLKNSASITGDTFARTYEHELPPVTVPSYLVDLPSQETITESKPITNSGKYDGIDLKNSRTITISGNVELYIVGDLILGNSAQLQVQPDSSLQIYVGGDIEGKNSSNFNNLTQDPNQFGIWGLDNCANIDLKNSGELYGTIYAPQANVIFFNSAAAYGSVVAKNFEQKNSSAFYYDASLRDKQPECIPQHFEVVDWTE